MTKYQMRFSKAMFLKISTHVQALYFFFQFLKYCNEKIELRTITIKQDLSIFFINQFTFASKFEENIKEVFHRLSVTYLEVIHMGTVNRISIY